MRRVPRFAFPWSVLLGGSFLVSVPPARADWRDDIGATRLFQTFSGVPLSAGIVTQVEASLSGANFYLPDAAHPPFAGIEIVNRGPGSGTSYHATAVGAYLFGSIEGLLPDTPTVHAYNASYWLEGDFLGFNGSTAAPQTEPARLQNHSWVATGSELSAASVEEIGRRLDFAVERDGFVCVAGTNNGASTVLPKLLVQAYNQITVGLRSGNHAAGFTAFDGAGRIKPDLVVPDFFVSYATPKVAGAAGVLLDRASAAPHALAGADIPRVVKALLLAGATKERLTTWARTTTRPLDLTLGAGELNLLLAYRTLESGRVAPGGELFAPETGWSAGTIAGGEAQTYFFEIPAGAAPAPFSVALTWHRIVQDGSPGPNWSPAPLPLVDLDLALYQAEEDALDPMPVLGELIDLSASPVDNVEHLYLPALAPGRYALVVDAPGGAASTDYALAWRATPAVSVSASAAEAREQDGAAGEFTLTRAGSTATPLLVPLSVGGDAVAGTHYGALPATVLIPAGAASVTLAVTPVADSTPQGDRAITLAVAADYSVAAGAPAQATVTLRDKPYDAWRHAVFTAEQLADSAVSGDAADPDADGLPNLLEYALGGAPLSPDAAAVAPRAEVAAGEGGEPAAARLILRHTEAAGRTDLVYTVEWTADLAGPWQSGAGVVELVSRETSEGGGGAAVVSRAVAPLGGHPRQFLRLRVERL